MGYTTDPSGVYRRASLSLLTSRYEGFGLVVAESLAHGCPVVSYDLKYGPADIIADGVDGFLVPSGDVKGLARRIVEVLSDDGLHGSLSEAALRAAARFSPDAFVARWSKLFNDLDAKGWD
jgi:poly(glycerol-phosphate) alpha-glucosyltransferase